MEITTDIVCPHCNEVQLRTGLQVGERVRCEACQQWFICGSTSSRIIEEEVELEDSSATGQRLLREVRKELDNIPVIYKYQLGKEIACGGMGRVYSAQDPYLRREVAVKVLLDKSTDEDRARFVEEAQITGQLEHPYIVPIHDIGFTREGKLFFLMKKVQGHSLEEVLDDIREGQNTISQNFPLPRLLQIMENVCSAVAYAHSRGVIHRDLKPANIMLGDFGEVQVMDWGLAKTGNVRNRPEHVHTSPGGLPKFSGAGYKNQMNAALAHPHPQTGVSLSEAVYIMRSDSNIWGTRRGTVAGTPAYMSPEQARGDLDSLDERSDIYSLGAILYEILTGTPPVLASTETQIVQEVVNGNIQQPSMRAPTRRIPEELSRIAMKALATDPQHRYISVLDFQNDLRSFLDGLTVYRSEDNFWATLFRLSRHYKGASFLAGMFITLIVFGAAFGVAYIANLEEERQQTKLDKERTLKNKEQQLEINRGRAKFMLEQARKAVNRNEADNALQFLENALNYDKHLRDARLLKAEILIFEQDYKSALAELEILLDTNPNDSDAREKAAQCRKAMREMESPMRDMDSSLPELSGGENLQTLWEYPADAASAGTVGMPASNPLWCNGYVLAADMEGRVHVLLENGSPLKTFKLNGYAQAANDGGVFFIPLANVAGTAVSASDVFAVYAAGRELKFAKINLQLTPALEELESLPSPGALVDAFALTGADKQNEIYLCCTTSIEWQVWKYSSGELSKVLSLPVKEGHAPVIERTLAKFLVQQISQGKTQDVLQALRAQTEEFSVAAVEIGSSALNNLFLSKGTSLRLWQSLKNFRKP